MLEALGSAKNMQIVLLGAYAVALSPVQVIMPCYPHIDGANRLRHCVLSQLVSHLMWVEQNHRPLN